MEKDNTNTVLDVDLAPVDVMNVLIVIIVPIVPTDTTCTKEDVSKIALLDTMKVLDNNANLVETIAKDVIVLVLVLFVKADLQENLDLETV